ncbi:MAG: Asp-tRNA(Asn)/Glu-tRNA(Gln) amidotransferase subunit GatC [Dethiobacteria bacterium]
MDNPLTMIDELAALAHLDLSPEEKKYLQGQLKMVLDVMAKVQELDVPEVEPASHLALDPDILRDDEVRPSLTRKEVSKNMPQSKGSRISK